jgi:VanZ family protein
VPVTWGFTSRWIAAAGAVLLVAVAADSLVPVSLQVRLGLHWLVEHFLAYFVLTLLFCLAWPRPIIVAASLMAIAGVIEALQGLTADRIPDLATAFCGAAGVLVAALLASLVTDVWQTRLWQNGRARSASG